MDLAKVFINKLKVLQELGDRNCARGRCATCARKMNKNSYVSQLFRRSNQSSFLDHDSAERLLRLVASRLYLTPVEAISSVKSVFTFSYYLTEQNLNWEVKKADAIFLFRPFNFVLINDSAYCLMWYRSETFVVVVWHQSECSWW
jgi:hypothetical protein